MAWKGGYEGESASRGTGASQGQERGEDPSRASDWSRPDPEFDPFGPARDHGVLSPNPADAAPVTTAQVPGPDAPLGNFDSMENVREFNRSLARDTHATKSNLSYGVGALLGVLGFGPVAKAAQDKLQSDADAELDEALKAIGHDPDPVGTAMKGFYDRGAPEPGEGGETPTNPVTKAQQPQPDTLPSPEGGDGGNPTDGLGLDQTPWQGVPETIQAALPEGWLGNVQGEILMAQQSAQRMGQY